MTINQKVEALREQLKLNGLDAWIINGTDPHESEYVSERWRTRAFISGFTGSAGFVVVTMSQAVIWVDSRYFVQCADQIKDTCFEMRKLDGPDATDPKDFLKGMKAGIASETLMVKEQRDYLSHNINLAAGEDLINKIWSDRPQMPQNPVLRMTDEDCGESPIQKINRIREQMTQNNEDFTIISSLDDIAWILNLRGSDIADTPVFLAHLLIGKNCAKLFTPVCRFSNIDIANEDYEVLPYEKVTEVLSEIKNCTVRLNPARVNMQLFNALKNAKISEGREYSTDFKACKNEKEMEGMRIAHILDGIAMVNFLALVDRNEYDFSELSIAQALEDERMCEEDCLGLSFSTIAGYKEHGAIVHYSATEETDVPIEGNGLLVLDSGAQYSCGTTDITRTLLFGEPTEEEIHDYTLVLKGHLALANQIFPYGTNGHQLDILAHQFLWQEGMTYFHGTGHGVGFRLSVHEGPQRISIHKASAETALEKGMILSDEPGIYKEGKHGIRIENLVAVTEAFKTEFGQFYTFEVLTCCPYERRLIDKSMLSEEEIATVNDYHKWCYETLKDLVYPESLNYLEKATKPL